MPRLYSYVVKYDSGFAPNPFYGYCTLATCKPAIRKSAKIGDWLVGTGSWDRKVLRGDRLVYAMQVSEAQSVDDYWVDPRFEKKRPKRNGSKKQSCGDNIYSRPDIDSHWHQMDSFHSHPDGTPNEEHISRDTGPNRVLIGERFFYFGGEGPVIPAMFRDPERYDLCKKGRSRKILKDVDWIDEFVAWLEAQGQRGFRGKPLDWVHGNG